MPEDRNPQRRDIRRPGQNRTPYFPSTHENVTVGFPLFYGNPTELTKRQGET